MTLVMPLAGKRCSHASVNQPITAMKQTTTATPPEGQSKTQPPRHGFRLVRPYSTLAGAKAALDNGGRFWNLFTAAGDNRVSNVELAKSAGVLRNEANCFLFFDMALAKLNANEKAQVVGMFTPRQAKRYREHGPRTMSPAEAARRPAKSLVITEGVPRFERQITILQQGLIMVGKVMVPVTHRWPYDLYELRDAASGTTSGLRLAIWHKEARLPEVPTRFGGQVSESRVARERGETKEPLFVPGYHTPLA